MQSTNSEYVTSLSLSVALYTVKKNLFFFLNESVLILIRIFIIVSLLKYSKYTVWTWTLHHAYFHVIITFKYIVPKSEIKTVLYLNVKKLYLNKD